MKKIFMFSLLFLVFLVFIKYFVSDYTIYYNVFGYEVMEKVEDDYFYIEIKDRNNVYNYMFYDGRSFFKKRVKDIKVKEDGKNICLKPVIKGEDSYYVCLDDNGLYNINGLVDYEKSDDDFKYYKTLDNDEFVYIWKYDGFYFLNGKNYKSINIFTKDRYSNDLMIKFENFLVFPYYDDEYMFSKFVILDMENGDFNILDTSFDISYDSYYSGVHKNKLYLFDNRSERLYEINVKSEKVSLVGNDLKGYFKYVDGSKENASVSEFKEDKITYFSLDIIDKVIDKNYFKYVYNEEVFFKYFESDKIEVLDSVNDNIYFLYDNDLYRYNNKGSSIVTHYFEFNFNKENVVFVYNK